MQLLLLLDHARVLVDQRRAAGCIIMLGGKQGTPL